jgi:hypothetical protein
MGSAVPGGPVDPSRPRCGFPGCPRFVNSRGLCHVHWRTAKAAGVARPRPRPQGDEARFAAKLLRTEEGCLIWTGGSADPFGKFFADGAFWSPRRWAWARAYGEVPVQAAIRARCGNGRCCEVRHLYLVLRRRQGLPPPEGVEPEPILR